MKQWFPWMVLAAVMVWAVPTIVHASGAAAAAAKTVTVKGEIVDLGCYLGHGAMGQKHKGCATKCLAGGMPMGLLTNAGKLYLLAPNHDNGDPFAKAKDMAAEIVEVSGTLMQRNGLTAIDVASVKPAAAAAR